MEYLLAIALQDDERGRSSEASKMYSCAIELAIQAVSATVYRLDPMIRRGGAQRESRCIELAIQAVSAGWIQ